MLMMMMMMMSNDDDDDDDKHDDDDDGDHDRLGHYTDLAKVYQARPNQIWSCNGRRHVSKRSKPIIFARAHLQSHLSPCVHSLGRLATGSIDGIHSHTLEKASYCPTYLVGFTKLIGQPC